MKIIRDKENKTVHGEVVVDETGEYDIPDNGEVVDVSNIPVPMINKGYTYDSINGYALTPKGENYLSHIGIELKVHFFDPREKDRMISRLWDSCHSYQLNYLDSQGIAVLNEKILRNEENPKIWDILDWKNSLWDIYYMRKSDIKNGVDVSFNFSIAGSPQYSIEEALNY